MQGMTARTCEDLFGKLLTQGTSPDALYESVCRQVGTLGLDPIRNGVKGYHTVHCHSLILGLILALLSKSSDTAQPLKDALAPGDVPLRPASKLPCQHRLQAMQDGRQLCDPPEAFVAETHRKGHHQAHLVLILDEAASRCLVDGGGCDAVWLYKQPEGMSPPHHAALLLTDALGTFRCTVMTDRACPKAPPVYSMWKLC